MKKTILLLSALFLLSCSKNLLPSGTIKQEGFSETIPFNFDNGLPIIKVKIDGNEYSFLLDTGAPTVISPEVARTLNSKKVKKSIVSDSQGNNNKQEFILIDEIKIGRLHFNDIGAVVIDLKKSFEIKCLNLDGIIGSNQMSNAIWEIDYKNKNIVITDNFSGFKEPEGASKLHFIEMEPQKTPLVRVQVDSTNSKLITFDTGANGSIDLPLSNFESTINGYEKIKSFGNTSSGLYGIGKKDTIVTVKVGLMKLGTLQAKNQLISFENLSAAVIGNGFLKNFKTTINWKTKTIYLQQQDTIENAKVESFGFGIRYINLKPVVSNIILGSDAEKSGLKLGDEITEIEGIDLSDLTEELACEYAFKSLLSTKKEVSLTYTRNNEKQTIKISSKIFLE
ncbi:MAG: PDZ domain-containing protein [Flavobacterium sp.]|nr:MAG: PDZ domain-containing protein [Flavobacterium sp.]